jgi:hypothetical protein
MKAAGNGGFKRHQRYGRKQDRKKMLLYIFELYRNLKARNMKLKHWILINCILMTLGSIGFLFMPDASLDALGTFNTRQNGAALLSFTLLMWWLSSTKDAKVLATLCFGGIFIHVLHLIVLFLSYHELPTDMLYPALGIWSLMLLGYLYFLLSGKFRNV